MGKESKKEKDQLPEHKIELILTKEQYGIVLFESDNKSVSEYIIELIQDRVEEAKLELGLK